MFWGLCKLLTGITKWEDVKTLSSSGSFLRKIRNSLLLLLILLLFLNFNFRKPWCYLLLGDNAKVDLLVGDIYGTSYESIGLSADIIASRYINLKNRKTKIFYYYFRANNCLFF